MRTDNRAEMANSRPQQAEPQRKSSPANENTTSQRTEPVRDDIAPPNGRSEFPPSTSSADNRAETASSKSASVEKRAEITNSNPAKPEDISQKIGHVCNDRVPSSGKV
jgi:hypothetical protein